VIHFGDGAFDLGFSLTHFLSKAHYLETKRESFLNAARQYWNDYADRIGSGPLRQGLEARAVRHTLACLVARCVGRSPLEYLSIDQRELQAEVVTQLINNPPATIDEMTARFESEIEKRSFGSK